jgi:DNA-binding transcriptional regulator YiaG
MNCPACGKQPAHTVEQYHYLESGLNNVFVDGVGIFRCACGQEYIQLPGAQEVHNQVASALLNKPSLLTGPEAKFLRKWLRLTSDDLAKALGYTRVSVSRMENKGRLTVATERLLRLYASQIGNIPIDVEKLFPTISDTPDQKFKIVVGEVPPVIQYSVNAFGSALVLSSTTESLELKPFAEFMKPSVRSKMLAGVTTGFQYSVKASGAAKIVTPAESSTQYAKSMRVFAMTQELSEEIDKPSESAANQQLAQAA